MIDDPQSELAVVDPSPAAESRLFAPLWHTVLIVLLVAASSFAGARSAKSIARKHSNLLTYLASIALEWILAAIVLWGLRLRWTPLRKVLGDSVGGAKEWLADAGIAFVFWLVALTVLGMLAAALQPLHLHPEKIRDTVTKLAPTTAPEIFAWAALCISAGICEEFIFRGYLQMQFARIGHRAWIGVAASAILFGCAHGYEGWSGMLLIAAFGALFSILRLLRGNLRAGMIAHAWHDFFSGIVLYVLAHRKMLL